MDVPAFQQIPMDGLEFDRSDNRHIQITSSLSFEDEMSELYEAFYPSTTPHPHPLQITSVPDPFQHNAPPELTSPSDVSSQPEHRQQLAVLQSLQAQHQFQVRQQQYYLQQQQQPPPQQNQQRKSGGIRKKRKTDQLKTVYRVPAENILTVDKWAWRKYGQKPIKGSPFPRNYYRCSSSKGCTARKQVERSITEPEVYVVTYTGDHFHPWPLHRNALAGISRSSSHRIGCAVTRDLSCHVAAAVSPNSDPPPTNSEEDGLLLIPNSKYVDEDMLRGMGELGKWKTTASTTPNGSPIDGPPPTGFLATRVNHI